jgi:hypothetical protein
VPDIVDDAEFEEVPSGEERQPHFRRVTIDGNMDGRYDDHVPTDETRKLVSSMVAAGVTRVSMCLVMELTDDQMRRHYRREIDTALDMANARVTGKLFEKCMQGDVPSMIFWLRTRAKWKTADKLELSGPEGGPVQTQAVPAVVGSMTDEQRRLLRELARSVGVQPGEGEGDS